MRMREIVFRGKRTDNGEWAIGNLFIGEGDECEICCGTPRVRITYEVNPATVGQYTGLKDRNGKKIFEGDVVEFEDTVPDPEGYNDKGFMNRAAIEYGECGWVIYGDVRTATIRKLVYKGEFEGVVVGNIHDNSEMVKGEAT